MARAFLLLTGSIAAALAGTRILVVDDNATSRSQLKRQLGDGRMDCDVADNARRALELLLSAADAGVPYGLRLVVLAPSGSRSELPADTPIDATLSKPVREARLDEALVALTQGNRVEVARASRRRETSDAAVTPRVGPRPDVLVVEDTAVNQAVAVHMLEKCGYHPHVAVNGRKALEAMAKRPFAAVLMDCQMPELDGYETTREVRRLEQGGHSTPIIAMTANSMKGERERCLANGMDDYLTKPLRKQALSETMARWVPQRPVPARSWPVGSGVTPRSSWGARRTSSRAAAAPWAPRRSRGSLPSSRRWRAPVT